MQTAPTTDEDRSIWLARRDPEDDGLGLGLGFMCVCYMMRDDRADNAVMVNLTRLAGLPPAVKLTLAGLASLGGK